jgi:hypothetical protein
MAKKILSLVSEAVSADALKSAVGEQAAEEAEVLVVAPALNTRTRFFLADPDPAIERAEQVQEETVERLDEAGVDAAAGPPGEADPLLALQDALATYDADEIVLFTHAGGDQNWQEEGVVDQAKERFAELPVRHVVVDLDREGLPFDVTLVLANQTAAGRELVERLEQLAEERPHRFIAVVPQDSGDGNGVRDARDRLGRLLGSLRDDGIVAAGMIGDPDPYTAARNALDYFHISEIVVSTLPSNRSQWIEKGLIEKLERESGKPVLHVEASAATAEAA